MAQEEAAGVTGVEPDTEQDTEQCGVPYAVKGNVVTKRRYKGIEHEGVICSSCLLIVKKALEYFTEEGTDNFCEDCIKAMLEKIQGGG